MSPRPTLSVSIRALERAPAGTPMSVSLRSTREFATGNWRTFRPTYMTRPSPCNLDCPAGTDVRAFLALAADGDAMAAWRTIREHNPLPGVCGRVSITRASSRATAWRSTSQSRCTPSSAQSPPCVAAGRWPRRRPAPTRRPSPWSAPGRPG